MYLTIDNLNSFSPDQLKDGEVFEQIQGLAVEIERAGEAGEAKELADFLNKLLNETRIKLERELANSYQETIVRLKFIALSLLSDFELDYLFQHYLLFAIDSGVDFIERIDSILILYHDELHGNKWWRKFLELVRTNEEKLGEREIMKEGGNNELPTVKNWLKDYERFSELGRARGGVEEANYLSRGPNPKSLNNDDRGRLSKLIRLYDYLLFPEMGLGAVEEIQELPETITRIESPESEEKRRAKLIQLSQGTPEFNAKIKKAEEELLKTTNREIKKIKAEIDKAIGTKDDFKLMASVRILIRNNKLNFLWQENEELKVNFRPWLIKLGNEYGLDNEKLLSDFMGRPDQPVYFKEFLRYSLEGKIGYKESQAAEVGLQLGSLLAETGRKEFETMAYFDEASGEVKWTANKKTPQGLLTLPVY